jgi:hypothetical protein
MNEFSTRLPPIAYEGEGRPVEGMGVGMSWVFDEGGGRRVISVLLLGFAAPSEEDRGGMACSQKRALGLA